MKRFLIAGLLFGFAFAAQAQSSDSVTVKDEADRPLAEMQAADAADERRMSDRNCLRQTGSRITASHNAKVTKNKQQCAPFNGRSYSREDIERTGETDIADALRKLDPSVR